MIIAKSKNKNFLTEISDGNTYILSDIPKENGGEGNHLRPNDLILAGYAACLNMTIRTVLNSKNIQYEEVIVKARLDVENVDKTLFCYDVDIIGNIDSKLKEDIIAQSDICGVREYLSNNIEFKRKLL